jgi:hypothetical protein
MPFANVDAVTTTVGSRDDLADDWLNSGGIAVLEAGETTRAYPKRSELRRAEARASSRRGSDRRPPGSRPPGSSAGTRGPAAPASPGRGADAGRRPSPYGSPRLPIAVAPTAAVLPIRQTSTPVRPAGIDLPIQPAPSIDIFHRPPPPASPIVPIAIPAPDGALAPPPAPPELAAPVAPALDPAVWGLDLEPAPATGRRRDGQAVPEPQTRRAPAAPSTRTPVRLFGAGKAGAARLLVLALVVGAEGVAVTSMAGHARVRPADPKTVDVAGAYEFAALKPAALPPTAVPGAADRQASAIEAQKDALALSEAQDASSQSKVTAALSQAKAAADRVKAIRESRARALRDAQRDPKSAARVLAADRGWTAGQFQCLDKLWTKESGWRYNADNPSSSAYGIPQSLPGSKMASAGADWRTNPVTQIRWGLSYIADRYGTPCAAWAHSVSYNNY